MFLDKNEPGAGPELNRIQTPEKKPLESKQVCVCFIFLSTYVTLTIPYNA